jgi:hypothetical protein
MMINSDSICIRQTMESKETLRILDARQYAPCLLCSRSPMSLVHNRI